MGVRLPAEYQEVEYLESTGVQYINTGLSPSGDLSFDCKFYTYHADHPGYGNIFGSRINSNFYEYQLTAYSYGTVSVGTRSPAGFLPNTINVVSFDGTNVIVNGATKKFVGSKNIGNNNYPIILFGISQGGVASQLESDRIYYCIFGNEREFVPCYRKSDNKPGMYDLVTKQFFTNQGTGEFLVGPDVIDSISPWLVARRMVLMKEPELYPVGTDIRAKYGAVFVSKYTIDTITGEYVENSKYQASPVYMPISPKYTYWKRGVFPNRAHLSVLAFYDKDKNYISYYWKNDYNDFVIPDIPANARYARIAIPGGSATDIKIIRTA